MRLDPQDLQTNFNRHIVTALHGARMAKSQLAISCLEPWLFRES